MVLLLDIFASIKEAKLKTNFFSSINREVIDFDSTPIDISEIIAICKEYNSLGFYIQNQIDFILENGFDEAVKFGKINSSNLDYIKDFLFKLSQIYYLDAAVQAEDLLKEISKYEMKIKRLNVN